MVGSLRASQRASERVEKCMERFTGLLFGRRQQQQQALNIMLVQQCSWLYLCDTSWLRHQQMENTTKKKRIARCLRQSSIERHSSVVARLLLGIMIMQLVGAWSGGCGIISCDRRSPSSMTAPPTMTTSVIPPETATPHTTLDRSSDEHHMKGNNDPIQGRATTILTKLGSDSTEQEPPVQFADSSNDLCLIPYRHSKCSRKESTVTSSVASQRSIPSHEVVTIATNGVVDNLNISKDKEDCWPLWLARYEHTTLLQTQEQMNWLEDNLLKLGWEREHIDCVVHEIRSVSQGETAILMGCIDFLRTLLRSVDGDIFHSKQVLIASIHHYADCIAVRRMGFHDFVRHEIIQEEKKLLVGTMEQPNHRINSRFRGNCIVSGTSTPPLTVPKRNLGALDEDTSDIQMILESAARLKRAEIFMQVFLTSSSQGWTDPDAAGHMRGLLLSVTDDFRALAIRTVASLYRLEGILHFHRPGSPLFTARTPEVIRNAKQGLRIYATLAERLGMHRLKADIEDAAFRILYRRQYQVVSTLYYQSGHLMKSLCHFLKSDTTNMLHKDEKFMSEIEEIQISARVKQPFSLWKKLLKKKRRESGEHLAVHSVPDAVALRVTIRARRLTPDEDDALTRSREHLLCYYIQSKLMEKWGSTRVKDYIHSPKPNGYQSLHHTSYITTNGMTFPFEVQIRNEEMHRAAEYGLASHWVYKLGSFASQAPNATEVNSSLLSIYGSVITPDSAVDLAKPANKSPFYRGTTASYLDALVVAQNQLLQQHVYVFTTGVDDRQETDARLVSLPSRAKVYDALLAIQADILSQSSHGGSDVANQKRRSVWLNGRLTSLDEPIASGDVLLLAE